MKNMPPLTVAHRGASALARENTLPAFRLAMDHGVDMSELDVYLSRDGQLVVVHDGQIQPASGGPIGVAGLTAGELAAPEFAGGAGIPRLTDVFDLVRGRMGIYVELKGERTGAALGSLIAQGAADGVRLIAGSFKVGLVEELRHTQPDVPSSILFAGGNTARTMLDACRAVGARYAHICFRPFDAETVETLHRHDLLVMSPHTNDPAEARDFARLGIDVIASDDPRLLRNLLTSLGNVCLDASAS
ncbi:MAG: glycerophosphodiester phosphodiesterase [Chloroflexota bacterium]